MHLNYSRLPLKAATDARLIDSVYNEIPFLLDDGHCLYRNIANIDVGHLNMEFAINRRGLIVQRFDRDKLASINSAFAKWVHL